MKVHALDEAIADILHSGWQSREFLWLMQNFERDQCVDY